MYDGGKESDSAWRPPQQHLPSLSSATSELPVSILKYKGRSQKRCTVRRNYAPNLVKISHNLVTDTGHRRPDTADNFIFYPMLLCIVLDRK